MGWHKKKRLDDMNPVKPKPKPAPVVVPAWNPPMVTSVFSAPWVAESPYWTTLYDEPFIIVSGTEAPYPRPWGSLTTKDRTPALGEYDERQPDVAQWRLQKMKEAKIDVACYQIGWSHQHTAKYPAHLPPLDSPLLYRWAVDNHRVIHGSGVKFCLSNWDAVAGSGDGPSYFKALREDRKWTDDDLIQSMRLYARAVAVIMKGDDYWHIAGQPVLYRGWTHTLAYYREQFGFDVSPEQITSIWREEIQAATGHQPYLVATSMDPPARQHLKAWGFDCLTEYLLHGDGWENAMNAYRGWWTTDLAMCRDQGLGYIVPVTAGYDSEAWGNPETSKHMPTAAQFEAHVREARQLARDNRDVCKAVGSYAWSEIGEGGIIEPMQPGMLHDGDELVKAHARACT